MYVLGSLELGDMAWLLCQLGHQPRVGEQVQTDRQVRVGVSSLASTGERKQLQPESLIRPLQGYLGQLGQTRCSTSPVAVENDTVTCYEVHQPVQLCAPRHGGNQCLRPSSPISCSPLLFIIKESWASAAQAVSS